MSVCSSTFAFCLSDLQNMSQLDLTQILLDPSREQDVCTDPLSVLRAFQVPGCGNPSKSNVKDTEDTVKQVCQYPQYPLHYCI